MAIRAVVFDIGGVLEVVTTPADFEARWEREWDLAPGELDQRLEHLWRAGAVGTITEEQVRAGIVETLGRTRAEVDEFMADMWRWYVGTLNRELAEYLAGLHGPYLTGIVSNSFVGAREREEKLYRFHEMTDVIVYSHEVGLSKPDPRIYELACDRLGVRPDEMVFLDDYDAAVEGARRLGIHAILFRDNTQAIADIEALLRNVS